MVVQQRFCPIKSQKTQNTIPSQGQMDDFMVQYIYPLG